jgi:pimeloyl-ACP methyl ester carboxylesterase
LAKETSRIPLDLGAIWISRYNSLLSHLSALPISCQFPQGRSTLRSDPFRHVPPTSGHSGSDFVPERRARGFARLRLVVNATLAVVTFGMSGCSYFSNQMTPGRLEHGYTIILPGVEGKSFANSNLAQGLKNAGYPGAIEIDNWTTGSFLLFPVHLRNLERNRREAWRIAQKISIYQDRYPGRPVHLIGHSGGAGVALLTLESLPPGRKVTSATLLQAAVSPQYDLSHSLSKTEAGLWNLYSPLDFVLLGAGTSLLGTVDGRHTPAAGMIGFREQQPDKSAPPNPDAAKLHQVKYGWRMLAKGNLGGHLGPTWIGFSHSYLAPLLAEAETHRDATQMWSATVPVSISFRAPARPAQSGWMNGAHQAGFSDALDSSTRVQFASDVAHASEYWPSVAPVAPGRTD